MAICTIGKIDTFDSIWNFIILQWQKIVISYLLSSFHPLWENKKSIGPRHSRNPFHIKLQTPPKNDLFFGGGLSHQIFFSILEIRHWFKIWKTFKVSFWSICNILVNTWSTPKYFSANEIWRYQKMAKKCIFSEIRKFPTLLNQNLDVFSMDNVFSDVLDIDEE